MSKRVNLFMVGAAKSGTSSLARFFNQLDQVFVPEIKEPFFFLEGYGIKTLSEYVNLYEKANNETYLLDASTGYLFDQRVAHKIKAYNPDAKILICLRNPIDLVVSYWTYMRANGNEELPLNRALSEEVLTYRKSKEFWEQCEQWPASYWYLERAEFSTQVDEYLKVFEPKNVKILFFEELIKSTQRLSDLLKWLDITADNNPALDRVNQSGRRVRWAHSLRFSRKPVLSLTKKVIKRLLSPTRQHAIRRWLVRKSMTQNGYKKYKLTAEDRAILRTRLQPDVWRLAKLMNQYDLGDVKTAWPEFFDRQATNKPLNTDGEN
jgi:hypothetical protein